MRNQSADFIVKIVGILTIIYALPYLRPIIDSFFQRKFNFFEDEAKNNAMFMYSLISSSTITILLLLIGTLLIFYSKAISNKLLSADFHEENVSELPIQSIGFSIVGIFLLTSAIPQIVQPVSHYYLLQKAGDAMPAYSVSLSSWSFLVAGIVKAIIGILLFLGSNGLRSIWYFFQRSRPLSKMNINT